MNQKSKKIIKIILLVLATGIVMTSPYGSKVVVELIKSEIKKRHKDKNLGFSDKQIYQSLYYLKNRNIVKIDREDDKTIVVLTEKGRKRKLKYDFDTLEIEKPEKWDRKWRILMFDIPEKKRVFRDVLREKLKNIGFLQFQESVWIYPYECKDEVDFMSEILKIAPYINMLTVEIEEDGHLKRYFKLS